jgi:Raf kinase inhibitor-like YbhB/YbcL family protein
MLAVLATVADDALAQNPPGAPPAQPGRGGGGRGRAVRVMTLTSPGFTDGAQLPVKYAQPGEEVSPPIAWSGAPDSTASFVLVIHDADAAIGNGTDDVLQWLVWNIPGTATSLPEGIPQGPQLADGTRQISVSGPYYRGAAAPATGPNHHYLFELYALDATLDVPPVGATAAATRAAVMAAMAGHVRGKAVMTALFRRASLVWAFTGLTLIDGTDRPPVPKATIVVRDGRIVAAGPAGAVTIPDGAERVALDGKTVIPGLINAHGHVTDAVRDLRTYAAYGVTTVFSLGDEPATVFAARAEQATPALGRSRVFLAGPVLAPKTPEDARTQVAALAARKVDIVKIRVDDNLGTTQKMPPEVYRAVIDEAHRLGMRVAVHLFYLADAKAVLAAGTDFIAHSIRDAPVDDVVIAAMKARGVCLSPTLMREVSTFVYGSTPDFFTDPLFLAHANAEWVATLKEPARQQAMRESSAAQRYKAALEVASRNVKRLADAGVPIALGTDTGPTGRFQGYFELMELELMVKAGLTPRRAIAAATRDAARCMKLDRDVGTLEPGKWADFVALDASPLLDIGNVRKISSVWIAGNRVAR